MIALQLGTKALEQSDIGRGPGVDLHAELLVADNVDSENAEPWGNHLDITPSATTLRQLVAYDHRLTIPTFQRGYEWEKEQVEAFWESIVSAASGESLFFGPMVTLTRPAEPSQIQIVDGQQRLTTVFLTLSLLRDWVREQGNPLLYKGQENQQNVDTALRRELFFLDNDEMPDPAHERFAAAERIRAVFRDRVVADKPRKPLSPKGAQMTSREREETKDLRRAATLLKRMSSEYLDGTPEKPSAFVDHDARMRAVLKLKAALLDNFEIFTLNLTSEDDAYVLFESLNNRGLRLNPGDILRTISLGGVRQEYPGDESKLYAAVSRWTAIAESLGEFDLSNFLRHFLLSVTNERVQKKRVIQLFRGRIEAGSPSKEIHALESAAASYQLILPPHMHPQLPLEPADLQLSSAGLNLLNETHRLVLLGILLSDPAPNAEHRRQQARFLRAIESLTYRWLLKSGNAQELETLYQELVYKMRGESTSVHASLDYTLGTKLALSRAPLDKEVIGFSRSDRLSNLKYVLFRIEAGRAGGLPAPWLEPTVTIEHLAPQTSTEFWVKRIGEVAPDQSLDEDVDAYGDIVQRWGNLAVLEARLNKSVKNRDWKDKVAGVGKFPGLGGTQFKGTLDVAKQSDWNVSLIDHRTEWLANLGLALVSTEWVNTGMGPRKVELTWKPEKEN